MRKWWKAQEKFEQCTQKALTQLLSVDTDIHWDVVGKRKLRRVGSSPT